MERVDNVSGSTMTVREAVTALRKVKMSISDDTLRAGLRQKVFPFGDAVVAEGKAQTDSFYIYTAMFRRWMDERFPGWESGGGKNA